MISKEMSDFMRNVIDDTYYIVGKYTFEGKEVDYHDTYGNHIKRRERLEALFGTCFLDFEGVTFEED